MDKNNDMFDVVTVSGGRFNRCQSGRPVVKRNYSYAIAYADGVNYIAIKYDLAERAFVVKTGQSPIENGEVIDH